MPARPSRGQGALTEAQAGPLFAWAAGAAPGAPEGPARGAARPPAEPARAERGGALTPAGGAPPELAERLSRRFAARLGHPLELSLSRAYREPVRLEIQRGAFGKRARLRLHRGLPLAEERFLLALEDWLLHGRRARAAAAYLDRAIGDLSQSAPLAAPRLALEPKGRHHDLSALLAELLRAPRLAPLERLARIPEVGWGRFAHVAPKRGLWLGSYDARRHAVRIHPALDGADVPAFFLSSILFHELLHAVLPAERGPGGRREVHGPEFRAFEARFPEHQRALEFQRRHLPRLLAAARAGTRQARRQRG
jgi:hypothetical protein